MADSNKNKKHNWLLIIAVLLILVLLAVCALAVIGFMAFNVLIG